MTTSTDHERNTDSIEPEVPKRRTVWSFLRNIGAGLLALGWAALWLIDAGTCELEGIIWTCQKGRLVTEVNIVMAGFLVLFGVGALLRGILGLASGAWKEPASADRVEASVVPPSLP
jgi:hypothetical protein